MSDLLNMDKINALPQPLFVCEYDHWWWPVIDVDVQTGLMRIDVCGKSQVKSFFDFSQIRDDAGQLHEPDDFYLEEEVSQ